MGIGTYMFLLCLGQIVGQEGRVVLVDLGRDLIEPGDECMLDPVNQELCAQNQ
jgi:hypothetical protein